MTGWLIEGDTVHFGRISTVAVAPDGALLGGDDPDGVIYRVSFTAGAERI